jgi:hypothetical protein
MTLPKDTVSRTILLGFSALMAGLTLFLLWVGRYADRREAGLLQPVLHQTVKTSASDLRNCFGAYRMNGLALGGRWTGDAASANGVAGMNHASEIRVRIFDQHGQRLVEIATLRARALRQAERDDIAQCLAMPAMTSPI